MQQTAEQSTSTLAEWLEGLLPAAGVWIKAALAGFAGLWAGAHPAFTTLLLLMACDWAAGLCAALARKRFSAETGREGLGKKGLILILVAAIHALTRLTELRHVLGGIEPAAAVAAFYCLNEGLSITEKLAAAGVPLPPGLKGALKKLR